MLKNFCISLFLSLLTSLTLAVFHNILITPQDQLLYSSKNNLEEHEAHEYNGHAVSEEIGWISLEGQSIKLLPGTAFREVVKTDPRSLNQCIESVTSALKSLPKAHTRGLGKLTLSFDPLARRGLAGGDEMIIRCNNVEEKELIAVAVHETGHIVDTGISLAGRPSAGRSSYKDGKLPIYNDDPSIEFYKLSFLNEKATKDEAEALDFVSRYAAGDVFEDFAETYTFYVLHGAKFRTLKETNQVLAKKYDYMKLLFDGKEYGKDEENLDILKRVYDTTTLDYELEEFLNI